MGIKQRESSKAVYLNARQQKNTEGEVVGVSFFLSTDKDQENPIGSVSGIVTDFFFKEEEFNGSKEEKLYLTVEDDDVYRFGVKVNSPNYTQLINQLKSADLTQPLEFSVGLSKAEKPGDKRYTTMFVKQNGENLKYFYKKGDKQLPEWVTAKVGTKMVTDKTDYENALRKVVEDELKAAVAGNKSSAPQDVTPDSNTSKPQESSDLPF